MIKQKINYFYYIKQIFITALFMFGFYCLAWIGAVLDLIYNQ